MKNKLVPLLGIAFVVALVATGIFYGLFVSKMRNAPNPRYSVVVAARALPRGTVLQPSGLKVAGVEAVEAPKGAYTSVDQVAGLTVLDAVKENDPVVDSRISSHRSVPIGMRAISVHVTDSSGVVAMLQPGYKVDVQVVTAGARGELNLRTVLQNIEVLTTSPADNGRPRVNLLVAPEDADLLGLADSSARVRIALRNPGDSARPNQVIILVANLLQRPAAAKPQVSGGAVQKIAASAAR